LILRTVTGANGEQQIITTYAIILASQAQVLQTGSASAGVATSTAKPGLQSGASGLSSLTCGLMGLVTVAVAAVLLL